MGVDHSISSGVGYIVELPEDTVDELYDGDGQELLSRALKTFPDVAYIVGGSYYEADNIHYAIVAVRSGFNDIEDMAGIYPVGQDHTVTVTDDVRNQLEEAYNAITGDWPKGPPVCLVAGLWH